MAGASNVLPPTGSITCLAWLLAWLLERICRGTVPVSPSSAASPTAAHQNASGPRAVDAAAPALQRRAGPLAASLPRRNKLGCIFVTFLVLCTSVRVYLHRNVCRHVWVRACVAKGSLHLRCACEYRGKFQRGAVGWGGALFFFNFNGLFSYFWFQVWTLFLFFCKGWAGVCFGLIDKVRALIRTKFLCLLLW